MSRHRSIRFLLAALVVVSFAPLAAQAAVAGDAPERVRLVSAGDSPREQLRLTPTAGDVINGSITLTMGLEQSGAASTQLDQTVQVSYSATVLDVATDGNFRIEFAYGEATLLDSSAPRSQRDQIERSLAFMANLVGEYTLTPRGTLVDSEFVIPEDADPLVAQLLDQLSTQIDELVVPFPEAPVGIGARWRITSDVELLGIRTRQVYTYEVRGRQGDVLDLEISFTQTGRRGSVDIPGVPARVDVSITHFKVHGSGSVTCDLAGVLPSSNQVRASGRQEFLFEDGSDSATLTQKILIEATFEEE
jgi:hypothetical protein